MIAPLGRGLILLALLASSTGAFVGFAAGFRGSAAGAALTRRLAYVFAAAMVAANLLMVWALLARDFCVGYVAHVSSRQVWPAKNRDPVMQWARSCSGVSSKHSSCTPY